MFGFVCLLLYAAAVTAVRVCVYALHVLCACYAYVCHVCGANPQKGIGQ